MNSAVYTIQQLKEEIRSYLATQNDGVELPRLEYALEDITQHHADQVRKSGEPFIIHPLRVAWLICDAGLDAPTVVVALLHDIIEDTVITKEDIRTRYGDWYAEMVDGLTKITQAKDSQGKRRADQEATYRKMLMTMVKDVRILFIKLFDRLDNMRDMESMPRHKQRRISRETYNVYVPLAKRLGLEKISQEFGTLCFQYLYPNRYQDTLEKLKDLKKERQSAIQNMTHQLLDTLNTSHVDHVDVDPIFVRPDFYILTPEVEKILEGVRILVRDNVLQTYQVLGVLHTEFSAVPLKIRDYISNPRWDGYKGLQTEIIVDGEITHIEIATRQMHASNWHGIMGHWKGTPGELAEYYRTYLDQIDHIVGEKEPRMDEVLRYSQAEQVQVFTPQGDIKFFPKGATVLDFAYSIHTDLGNSCVGAHVNVSSKYGVNEATRKRVPRERQLIDGESVNILTSPTAKPLRAWLNHVLTAKGRVEIQRSLRLQNSSRIKLLREESFRRQLRNLGEDADAFIQTEAWRRALETEGISWNGFLEKIATKKLDVRRFLKQYNLITASRLERSGWQKRIFSPFFDNRTPEVTVKEVNDPLLHFPECCSPIPGDKVLGLLTEHQEMEIHRTSCEKVKSSDEQAISVAWDLPEDDAPYPYTLHLLTVNMPGVLFQVTKVIKNLGVGIKDSQSAQLTSEATIDITLEPTVLRTYNKILARLRALKTVKKIL